MALTLTQMIARVRDNTGRQNATTNPASQITGFLNDRLKQLARMTEWRDLANSASMTCVVGTYRYALPTDCKDIETLRLIDGTSSITLRETTIRRLDDTDAYQDASDSGVPEYYAQDGQYIELYPKPDTAYTLRLRYTRWPTELSAGTDTAAIMNADDALIAGATADLFGALGMTPEATYWEAQYHERAVRASIQDNRRNNLRLNTGAGNGDVLPGNYWYDPSVGL